MAATMSTSLIDLKQLGKPAQFDGSPDKWAGWCFKFEAWCRLLPDHGTSVPLELMDRAVAAVSDNDVNSTTLGAEATAVALSLYYILVLMVAGRALMIVQEIERCNGLMAWRKLKSEYEDSTGHCGRDVDGHSEPAVAAGLDCTVVQRKC